MKKRTRRILISVIVLVVVFFTYAHGSRLSKIEITQVNDMQADDDSVHERAGGYRPSARAMLIIDGQEIYSEIKKFKRMDSGDSIVVSFDNSFALNTVSKLELQDVAISRSQKLPDLSTTMDSFDKPKVSDSGEHFTYEFKSRWGF